MSKLPRRVLKAKIVECTTDLHNSIANMVGAEADVVLKNATALDRADDVLNPHPTLRNRTIIGFLGIC